MPRQTRSSKQSDSLPEKGSLDYLADEMFEKAGMSDEIRQRVRAQIRSKLTTITLLKEAGPKDLE